MLRHVTQQVCAAARAGVGGCSGSNRFEPDSTRPAREAVVALATTEPALTPAKFICPDCRDVFTKPDFVGGFSPVVVPFFDPSLLFGIGFRASFGREVQGASVTALGVGRLGGTAPSRPGVRS